MTQMAARSDFEIAFRLLIGHEGVFSNDPRDRGNWTSGVIGQGDLKGTKYGIAAHVYPTLDIKNLTLGDAHNIYFRDYWSRAGCPDAPPRLAFVLFDAAVNNGVGAAVRWLQQAVGAGVDGAWGPLSRAALTRALQRHGETHLIVEVHAHRLRMMAGLSTWGTFRGGWSRRLVKVPFEAAEYWPAEIPPGGAAA